MAEELWVERLIREAIESGRLEPTEGVGRPIPELDSPRDPLWWVRHWVERENLRGAAGSRSGEEAAGPDHER